MHCGCNGRHPCLYMSTLKYSVQRIVTYPRFAWLIRRVLDLMIEFIGPLYNWLQQFTNHYLTVSSSSDWTLHWNYSDFQLNCQLLLAPRYTCIASGRATAQKTYQLPSNWYMRTHRKHLLRHRFYCCVHVLRALPRNGSTLLSVAYLLRACLPSRSLAMDLHVTISIHSWG
jgi:hypothetical protein